MVVKLNHILVLQALQNRGFVVALFDVDLGVIDVLEDNWSSVGPHVACVHLG